MSTVNRSTSSLATLKNSASSLGSWIAANKVQSVSLLFNVILLGLLLYLVIVVAKEQKKENDNDHYDSMTNPSSTKERSGETAYSSNNTAITANNVAANPVNTASNSAESYFVQQAQSTGRPGCSSGTVQEAHPGFRTSISGPSMTTAAATYSSAYPANGSVASLQNGNGTGGCADNMASHQPTGGGDWTMSIQNLMPTNWRSGVGCPTGQDPGDTNRWTRFAPQYDAYKRYISAAGAARLTVNERSAMRKFIGINNDPRPQPPVPLTNSLLTPFQDSPLRLDFLADHFGYYPGSNAC